MSTHVQTIAIAATFTAEPLKSPLEFWARELDLPLSIEICQHNQVFQQLLDSSSLFSRNLQGVNVVLVRLTDFRGEQDVSMEQTDLGLHTRQTIERNMSDCVNALKSAAERSAIPYLICLCPLSPALLSDKSIMNFARHMEDLVMSMLAEIHNISVMTMTELTTLYPTPEYYNAYSDRLAQIPYTPHFYTALGTLIIRKSHVFWRMPYKVIALDCDQVLWKGVVGEDGYEGIEIDSPRKALQNFMVAQYNAGKLICLCSKNNQEDVFQVFERCSTMSLRRDHIISWRLNWKPKSENLQSLAEELKLGLESFIFIDDNPIEIAEVQAHCPQVLTLQLPSEIAKIPKFLHHVWAFDFLKATKEDQKRTHLYRRDLERKHFQQKSLTFRSFLESLDLHVQISPLALHQVPRAAQLTQRTNQFNCAPRRRTEGELQDLILSKVEECYAVEASDRFGEYGLVGIFIFRLEMASIFVHTLLLSCRALGKGIEHCMIVKLGEIALERKFSQIDVSYVSTKKNLPALAFLEAAGGSYIHDCCFRLQAAHAATVIFNLDDESCCLQ